MNKIKDFTIKHTKLLYIIAAAVIIIISCYFGLQGQENWTSEKYGTTSDDQIGITGDNEYRIEFTISEDNFRGIFVRISNRTRKYNNEKLHFYLYDEDNNLISDYVMHMKAEMYNVDTMVPLPFKNSKGKKVSLYILGEEIDKTPYLFTSKNSNINSKFYINNVSQKNVLVLTALYMTESRVNFNVIIGGTLLLLILGLYYSFLLTSTELNK